MFRHLGVQYGNDGQTSITMLMLSVSITMLMLSVQQIRIQSSFCESL